MKIGVVMYFKVNYKAKKMMNQEWKCLRKTLQII